MAANFYYTTWCHIPEDSNLQNLNLIIKICNMIILFNPCFGFHEMWYSKLSKYYIWTKDSNIKFNENPIKHETSYAYGVMMSLLFESLNRLIPSMQHILITIFVNLNGYNVVIFQHTKTASQNIVIMLPFFNTWKLLHRICRDDIKIWQYKESPYREYKTWKYITHFRNQITNNCLLWIKLFRNS
jgi:hypothetical protein